MDQKQSIKHRFWIRGLVPVILIGIALVHTFVGIAAGRELFTEITREGFWDTVHTGSVPISRPLLQWFLVSGLFLFMLGHLAFWVERQVRRPLPWGFGVELFVMGVFLGVISGGGLPAWLFAAGGIYIIIVARKFKKDSLGESETI